MTDSSGNTVAACKSDNPEALLGVLHRLDAGSGILHKKKKNAQGKVTNKLYPASLASHQKKTLVKGLGSKLVEEAALRGALPGAWPGGAAAGGHGSGCTAGHHYVSH